MMAEYKNVFSPLRFGNVEIKNRIATPPMLAGMASPDGFVTREMIEFYQAFARGGAGIVTVGDALTDYDYAPGHFYQLNLGDDRVISGLADTSGVVLQVGPVDERVPVAAHVPSILAVQTLELLKGTSSNAFLPGIQMIHHLF